MEYWKNSVDSLLSQTFSEEFEKERKKEKRKRQQLLLEVNTEIDKG